MNCLRSLRSVAIRRRPSCSALFSIRSSLLLLLLSLSSTAKTSAQEASFGGHVVSAENGDQENAGGPGYAHGLSSDLLGILTKADGQGQGEERGGGSGEKQRWSNRGWSQRGSARMSPLFREDGWPLSGRRAENDGSSQTWSDGGRFRYGETVFPLDEASFLSGENGAGEVHSKTANGFHLAALTMGGRRGLDEKRKWERNTLRVWGKRNDDLKDLPDYPNMRRRKWENLPLRVWGK